MKKTSSHKLMLSTETLCTLSGATLARVAGGAEPNERPGGNMAQGVAGKGVITDILRGADSQRCIISCFCTTQLTRGGAL